MANFTSTYGLGDIVKTINPRAKKKKYMQISGEVESVSFRRETIFYQVRFQHEDGNIHIWSFEEHELEHTKGSDNGTNS